MYSALTEFAVSLGASKVVANFILALFLILFVLFLIKILQGFSKSNPEKDESETRIRGKTNPSFDAIPKKSRQSSTVRFKNRQFSRVNVKLKANLIIPENDNDRKDCALLNLSLSGVSFVSPQQIPNGTRVQLQLPVLKKMAPDDDFTVSGEVVWVKPIDKQQFEYGIRFFHLMRKESDYMELIIEKFK